MLPTGEAAPGCNRCVSPALVIRDDNGGSSMTRHAGSSSCLSQTLVSLTPLNSSRMACVLCPVLCDSFWGDIKKHIFTPDGSPTDQRSILSVLTIYCYGNVADKKQFKVGEFPFGLQSVLGRQENGRLLSTLCLDSGSREQTEVWLGHKTSDPLLSARLHLL